MLRSATADKLGNNCEALWTLTEALRVLRGDAGEMVNEDAKDLSSASLLRDATRGIKVSAAIRLVCGR